MDIAPGLLLLIAMVTPLTGLPPAVTVTVYALVCVRANSVSTATLLAGPVTLIAATPTMLLSWTVPLFPWLVAVISALPAAAPVTTPVALTVALPAHSRRM